MLSDKGNTVGLTKRSKSLTCGKMAFALILQTFVGSADSNARRQNYDILAVAKTTLCFKVFLCVSHYHPCLVRTETRQGTKQSLEEREASGTVGGLASGCSRHRKQSGGLSEN